MKFEKGLCLFHAFFVIPKGQGPFSTPRGSLSAQLVPTPAGTLKCPPWRLPGQGKERLILVGVVTAAQRLRSYAERLFRKAAPSCGKDRKERNWYTTHLWFLEAAMGREPGVAWEYPSRESSR